MFARIVMGFAFLGSKGTRAPRSHPIEGEWEWEDRHLVALIDAVLRFGQFGIDVGRAAEKTKAIHYLSEERSREPYFDSLADSFMNRIDNLPTVLLRRMNPSRPRTTPCRLMNPFPQMIPSHRMIPYRHPAPPCYRMNPSQVFPCCRMILSRVPPRFHQVLPCPLANSLQALPCCRMIPCRHRPSPCCRMNLSLVLQCRVMNQSQVPCREIRRNWILYLIRFVVDSP